MVARILFTAAGLYTLALTGVSLVRIGTIRLGSFNPTDKLLHCLAYAGLVLIWKSYFLFGQRKHSYIRNVLLISAAATVFGIFIEVLQGALTDFRQPDWQDGIANAVGVVIAAFILLLLRRPLQRLKSKINLIF